MDYNNSMNYEKERRIYDYSIIVAPKPLHRDFYLYKAAHPRADMKIVDLRGLEEIFHPSFQEDALRYLVSEKGMLYNEANDTMKAICKVRSWNEVTPNLKRLKALRDELVKLELLTMPLYPERNFLGRDIVVAGYPDTMEVSRILEGVPNISCSMDYPQPKKRDTYPTVYDFYDIYGECHYVCNRIAKLLDDGVSPDDIYISGYIDAYRNIIGPMALSYGFEIELSSSKKLSESEAGRLFLIEMGKGGNPRDILSSLERRFSSDPDYQLLSETILFWDVESIENSRKPELFRSILYSKKAKSVRKKNLIRLLDGYFAPEGSHVFVIGFSLDNAPHRRRDDDPMLNDLEKAACLIPTSVKEGEEEKGYLIDFLRSPSIVCLSRCAKSYKVSYYDSPLMGELKLNREKDPVLDYEYSVGLSSLWLAHIEGEKKSLDKVSPFMKTLKESPYVKKEYASFDHAYKPFKGTLDKKNNFSYSAVSTFYKCPFHYYCSKILGIDDGEKSFSALVGSVFHNCLELSYDPISGKPIDDFDLDSVFEKAVEDVSVRDNYPLTSVERLMLSRLKEELRVVIAFNHENEKKMDGAIIKTELKALVDFGDYQLNGMADKIIYTGASHEYGTIVDYKTGSERFKANLVKEGLSLQLPTYLLLMKESSEFGHPEPIGAAIEPILEGNPTIGKYESREKRIYAEAKLSGAFIDDQEKIKTIDPGYRDSEYIASMRTTGEGAFNNNAPIYPKSQFDEWIEIARSKYDEADRRIKDFDFPISPAFLKGTVESCKYCPFSDVCYKKESDTRTITTKEEAKQ